MEQFVPLFENYLSKFDRVQDPNEPYYNAPSYGKQQFGKDTDKKSIEWVYDDDADTWIIRMHGNVTGAMLDRWKAKNPVPEKQIKEGLFNSDNLDFNEFGIKMRNMLNTVDMGLFHFGIERDISGGSVPRNFIIYVEDTSPREDRDDDRNKYMLFKVTDENVVYEYLNYERKIEPWLSGMKFSSIFREMSQWFNELSIDKLTSIIMKHREMSTTGR